MKIGVAVGLAAIVVVAMGFIAGARVAYPDYAVPRLEGVTIKGLPPVTGRICVDQFGYLPGEVKVAVISSPVRGYNAGDTYTPGKMLEVRKATGGAVVLRGSPRPWKSGAVHEDSGDRGWWFDFSALRTAGRCYVYDPSTRLRSPVFSVGKDVYRGVLRAACRSYFYQRLSYPLKPPYAETPWIMPSYMDQDRRARAVWGKEETGREHV